VCIRVVLYKKIYFGTVVTCSTGMGLVLWRLGTGTPGGSPRYGPAQDTLQDRIHRRIGHTAGQDTQQDTIHRRIGHTAGQDTRQDRIHRRISHSRTGHTEGQDTQKDRPHSRTGHTAG
jgi:hypothetical protein